ncbi:CAP domain-containing protein [Phenylobacterium sp.]|uniref:CAP domain-containing protein n=1 Tax=Phenylobacterium sp. TaxID=1871053 RepID=UPI002735D63E|nr:CAP domain-containing protein [Phenylobacterium sp.]MDP3855067.1 CAP domain-containing protein [Phenylobacterium sp.]
MRTPLRLALPLLIALAAPHVAQAGQFEDDVLAEINFARANPAAYARELRNATAERQYGGGLASVGYADEDALAEAVDFLRNQPALPPLRHDDGLAAAAEAFARAQARRGDEGHGRGPEALGPRLQRHGVWAGLTAESLSYGYDNPRDVVIQLIVDSGVPGRGHRKDIFRRTYQAAGVACGGHAVHGAMCVIDYAGAFAQR